MECVWSSIKFHSNHIIIEMKYVYNEIWALFALKMQ